MPATSLSDAARDAATALTHALITPHPTSPFPPMEEEQLAVTHQLAKAFERVVTPVTTPTVALPRVLQTTTNNKSE